jgi:hypothetical protein
VQYFKKMRVQDQSVVRGLREESKVALPLEESRAFALLQLLRVVWVRRPVQGRDEVH